MDRRNIRSLKNEVHCRLGFIVEKDGTFSDFTIMNDEDGIGQEAVRIMKTMPAWEPAIYQDEKVRSHFTLPINIRFNSIEKEEDRIYGPVQALAAPKEGMAKFRDDFIRKFKLTTDDIPKTVKQVTIRLKFTVEKDGTFSDIEVLEDMYNLGNEAIRVLKTMPAWYPKKNLRTGVKLVSRMEWSVNVNIHP